MSKLDDIIRTASIKLVTPATITGKVPEELYDIENEAKQQIKDLILELANQVELETNIATGIPDAIALLCQKVSEL
jgi:hypothetical protein